MEYTLTKEKKDDWSGIVTYGHCQTGISPETGRRGEVVTGLTPPQARELEKEMFLEPNELAPNSPYWQTTFNIPFNGLLKLDDEVPQDRLYLAVLKSMKKVAVGRDDFRKKSKAIYLLTSKTLETKTNSEKFDVKEQAWKLYFKLPDTTLKQVAVVLEKSKVKGRVLDISSMDMESVKNQLRSQIESNASVFVDVASDDKLGVKFEVIELVTHRILSSNSGGYFQKNDLLAPDLDSMVEFMENPHNQTRVIQLKQQLKAITKK
jgi:hypothetical protein